ncbi:MAG: hypothetical protein LWW86_12930 [Micrococcales bacterium]|nr:hypothetical protein [Micrococcales bacterium]
MDWQPAWSTSKVLVVAAYLKEVVGGDPTRLSAEQRRLITAALTTSDGEAITALHNGIPGGSGPAITQILRAIGDTQTSMPNRAMSRGEWSAREQVRFLCALHGGRVVTPAASRYIVGQMRPVASQSWGLGRVGATAFKGGWIGTGRPTRQMGLLDGYAVAVITTGTGPVTAQSDGDSAHVADMDRLAGQLATRLRAES